MCGSSDYSGMSCISAAPAKIPNSSVRVFDTTLRDGAQTPGVNFSVEDKVEIAERLQAFGLGTIEAGFPASSPGDFEAVSAVARAVRDVEVAALARCCKEDIDAAARALEPAAAPVVHVVLGTSDIHLNTKLRMSRTEAIRAVRDCVTYARSFVDRVEFSLEDATRTERPFLHQVVAVAVEAGASRINIADTVGGALPEEFGRMIRDVVRNVAAEIVVSAHCHNDMGLATANTVAAVMNGARQIEVTVNGIGERAGNASVEEVAVVLAMKSIANTGIDLSQIAALSRHVSEVSGVPVQPNKAIVGANAFAHSSGIHQDGILKDPRNYEFVAPETVGAEGHDIVLTARSGRAAVAHRAAILGHTLSRDRVERVYRAFIEVADSTPGAVSDQELEALVKSTIEEAEAEQKTTALSGA